jgi:hypothetical protein
MKNALQPLVETKGKKSRHRDTGIAQNFALPQFAAAILDGRGMIVSQTKRARGVRSRRGRPVTQGDQSINWPHQRLRDDAARGVLRPIEMYRNGAVRPGIFELMTAVARKYYFNTQSARSFSEAARLIAKLARENEKTAHGWNRALVAQASAFVVLILPQPRTNVGMNKFKNTQAEACATQAHYTN